METNITVPKNVKKKRPPPVGRTGTQGLEPSMKGHKLSSETAVPCGHGPWRITIIWYQGILKMQSQGAASGDRMQTEMKGLMRGKLKAQGL